MKHYASKIAAEIQVIESKEYFVKESKVTFFLELVPADMKWLASISSELSNAAYYFSTFANVNNDNKHTVNGSFGPQPDCTWQPWKYKERMEVAGKVGKLKKELEQKKLSVATKQKKVLESIKSLKSRQEFPPLLGPLIDKAYAEPLHNANNACQFLHKKILEFAIAKSNLPSCCVDVSALSVDSPFRKYLLALKFEVKASRLRKKVLTWFRNGRTKSFDYRFNGKESKLLCHNFMRLINCLSSPDDSQEAKLRLATLAFCCVKLRDAVSMFSRVVVNKEVLDELRTCCRQFFNAVSLLLSGVNPTIWTVGYVIPMHSDLLFEKFGFGLGINSMQGREAKHVRLQQYARHSCLSKRWYNVLKHDFISSIWLRKQDPFHFSYNKSLYSYIPKRVEQPEYCHCGCEKDVSLSKCLFCSSALYKEVENTASEGKISLQISNLSCV